MKGNIIYMNEATCRALGYSKEELLTMNLKQLMPPQTAISIDERLKRVKKEGTIAFESERMHKDGRVFPVEIMARTVSLGNQKMILSVIRDITERKKAEEALRESEERHRALLELGERIGEAVVMLQDNELGIGRQVYVSNEWSRITGYTNEELLNMSIFDLIHPVDRKEAIKRHEKRIRGEILPGLYELTLIRKDGSKTSVEGTFAYSSYKGKPANVGYIRDISERKKMEEQLIVTDRLASIGELASGVAHELNNPLTGIIGFSELLLKKDAPEDIMEDLKIINREAQRTAQVVRNLLTFARKHDTAKKPVDINEAIQSVLDLRAYEQNVHNIKVITDFDTSLPEITGDIFRLQQVFVNIIINAEHFMIQAHKKGTLNITTKRKGDIIRTSFADDGPGIKEEHMAHLFDPFFTTKEVGKGTGLGLSICHGIIAEHEGNIYAESKLGRGATFIVELPIK
jgi:PAS domain S-box-containing protein